jgi:hypothetical protein
LLPRCNRTPAAAPRPPRAYRFVGGSCDAVDQVVCDIDKPLVLDGKLLGVELSGDHGTCRFVRMHDMPA